MLVTAISLKLAISVPERNAFLSGTEIASFREIAVTNNAKDSSGNYVCSGTTSYSGGNCGENWLVESMMTLNLTLGYKFKNGHS